MAVEIFHRYAAHAQYSMDVFAFRTESMHAHPAALSPSGGTDGALGRWVSLWSETTAWCVAQRGRTPEGALLWMQTTFNLSAHTFGRRALGSRTYALGSSGIWHVHNQSHLRSYLEQQQAIGLG